MKLDTDIWVSQTALADELEVSIQTIHNWVQRGKVKTKEYEFVPGSKIVLVDKTSISINDSHYKRRGLISIYAVKTSKS